MISRLAAFSLVLCQCYLIAEYGNQQLFAAAFAIFSLISVFAQIQIHIALRVLLGMAAGTYFLWFNSNFPPVVHSDWVLPAKYVLSASATLIFAQIVELVSTKSRVPDSFYALALGGLLTCFCRLEEPGNREMFYWIAIVSGGLVILGQLAPRQVKLGNPIKDSMGPESSLRYTTFWLTLIAIFVGTGFFAEQAKLVLASVRYFVTDQVRNLEGQERIGYSISGDLNSITKFKNYRSRETAIQVTCDSLPGYLRGRAFEKFTRHGWKTSFANSQIPLAPVSTPPNETFAASANPDYRVFRLAGFESGGRLQDNPVRGVRVQHSSIYVGNVFFTSLNSTLVEGAGTSAKGDLNQIVRDGFSTRSDYASFVRKVLNPAPLSSQAKRTLLQVAPSLAEEVGGLAREICSGVDTDFERMERVENFLRSGYQYSITGEQSLQNRGGLVDFITNRPPAHCEYFASAAAILLRLNGVPTRYVTGFGVSRQSLDDDNEGEMWVAQNRDAHAWVEAYDRQNQIWRIVEATPGMNLPKNVWDSQTTRLDSMNRSLMAGDSESNRDESESENTGRMQFLLAPQFGLPMILLIGLSGFLWAQYRFSHRSDYQLKDGAPTLRKLDRKLKSLNLIRRPSETLHQFAARIDAFESGASDLDYPWLSDAGNIYRRYAARRYADSTRP